MIDLSRKKLFYKGSVQELYEIHGNEETLVSKTTEGGSVFDVGTIFSIKGSDESRALFRHKVFSSLNDKNMWHNLKSEITKDEKFSDVLKDERLVAVLDSFCENGANTHHIGIIDPENGNVYTDYNNRVLSNLTLIKRFDVHKPEIFKSIGWNFYDYSKFYYIDGFVVPLEYIVRFGVTSGSSILRKYNGLSDSEKKKYLIDLGLEKELYPWDVFERPIIDLTTKFEPEDRNITPQEASLISGLDGMKFVESTVMTLLGSLMVQKLFSEMGLQLWDLKWEIAKKNNLLYYVDTIDTDSVRATFKADYDDYQFYVHFNKQAMRDYYKIMHNEWYESLNDAKNISKKEGVSFVDVLRDGQSKGLYKEDPIIDKSFLKIQEDKMNMVRDFSLSKIMDYKKLSLEIAESEIRFYKESDHWDKYINLNSVLV